MISPWQERVLFKIKVVKISLYYFMVYTLEIFNDKSPLKGIDANNLPKKSCLGKSIYTKVGQNTIQKH